MKSADSISTFESVFGITSRLSSVRKEGIDLVVNAFLSCALTSQLGLGSLVRLTFFTASNCLHAGYPKTDQILKDVSSQGQSHVHGTEESEIRSAMPDPICWKGRTKLKKMSKAMKQ